MTVGILLMMSAMMYTLSIQPGSFPKPLSAEEEQEYLKRAAAGDLEARNILIEKNMRLVAHIMKKYYANTSDQEDLISIGTIGLIKGITTFDQSKGARLATYAARCVENEILMHFRGMRKNAMDVSLSDYIDSGTEGTPLERMELIADEVDLLDQVAQREAVERLREAMEKVLTDQEKTVIRLRYGLNGSAALKQREVGKVTGISRSYISRLEKRALEKLRRALE